MSAVFTASDGRQIAYADTGGNGPAVLCLAGLTRTKADYADLAAHLAPQFRVVSMDYRGRGNSAHASEPLAEYTPAVEGRDALELLAHLRIPRTAIIGTSRGGLIGMGLAAHMPAAVGALVINDIGPVVEQAGLDFIMTYLGRDPEFADFTQAENVLRETYEADFSDLTDAQWQAWTRRSYADKDGRPVLCYDPRLRDATVDQLAKAPADLWSVYDMINCPMLVIRGENSDLLTAETVAEMARRRPELAQVTVPNRGHVPFLDEPASRGAIDTFLAGWA